MKKTLFITLILLFFSFVSVQASEDNKTDNIQNSNQMNNLVNYISNIKSEDELLKDIDARTYIKDFLLSGKGNITSKKIVESLTNYAFKEVKSTIKLMGMLVIICIISALLNNLQKAFSNETISNIAYFACYSLLVVILSKSFLTGVDLAKNTINSLSDFMTALMPVLMMLIAALGGISEAATLDPVVIGTINICTRLYVDMIIPIISLAFVLQFMNNISEDFKINKLTKLMNHLALWAQGAIMTIFIGIITIRGITAKTIDEVTVKTAKYAMDSLIPIVGKNLSDAISAIAGYSILLKNAISGLGLLIVVLIVLFPIIKLFIIAYIFKFTSALVEPICDEKMVNCINAAGDSLIIIMSCLISVSVMFFIMIAIVASAGKMIMG